MTKLTRIELAGFKSIGSMDLEIRDLNVLIGANGAGKSNLVSFFKLLNFAMEGALQAFVGQAGGANTLLHYGAKTTLQVTAQLDFTTDKGTNTYALKLAHAAGDILIFLDESVCFSAHDHPAGPALPRSLGAGHKESLLAEASATGDQTAGFSRSAMRRWRVFQFHDTSDTAGIRQKAQAMENRYLRHDGSNLAAYLYMLQQRYPDHYARIRGTLRQVAPFFDDFVLSPSELNPNMIPLEWKERDHEVPFGAHQLSDGTLRMMALVTLLLQPEDRLPEAIIIDEPELGLHPYALSVLAALVKGVAEQTQVVLSTQSVRLVDEFDPEDIVVVDRVGRESRFARQESARLGEWLEDYSLGELWEKNVLGGRPAR